MELPQLALDAYVAISLVIATPWLYHTFSSSSKSNTHQALSTLLLLHTLYILHALFVSPPQNIFKTLGLHLTASPEALRAGVADLYGAPQNVPPHLDTLLKKLGLMDLRLIYLRFGHHVLTTCSHCQSFDDFALYAFPGPLLEYIREIAFVGLLTLPKSSTAHLRPLGLGTLLAALLAEVYWTLTAQVVIPREKDIPAVNWHDNLLQTRHTLFLLLPILLTILPSLGLHHIPILGALIPVPENSSSHSNNNTLPPAQYQLQGQTPRLPENATLSQAAKSTIDTIAHIVPTLHLLKYVHAAVMRSQDPINPNTTTAHHEREQEAEKAAQPTSSPSLHTLASTWWATEAHEGHIVRTDPTVTSVLKSVGLSLDDEQKDPTTGDILLPEGQLKTSARMAVEFLKEQGGKPSPYWV
ncbi:hypothetical protein M413DRAFT_129174 [Hebeloma cylindrosporum]|uniref:Uncharacterized protein n=1 Tax=Hebeloma cylindrosporum TaxID=76867 RepID=A0A0C2YMI3_HEBCY|nr:hypothetical protein M413DRAFT_129174 [Hebeloma cylindrosporum h7]